MEPTKNIYQRLHAAMEAVQYVQKEQKKSGMQYTFVSHDAVVAKVRPALLANGVVLTASVVDFTQDGNRTAAKVRVSFVNVDEPADRIEVDAFGYGIDSQDKGPGKCVSYAVKYAILKTLCLETGDDPERDQVTPHETAADSRKKVIVALADKAIDLFRDGDEIGAFGELYEVVMNDEDNEGKLFLWNLLKPHSALRRSIKNQVDRERAMSNLPVEA